MIVSRARTFLVVGFAGLLLSVLSSLWFANNPAIAATTCTFAINSAKTEIGMACRSSSGNTIPFNQTLKKEGSTRIYSFTGPTGCKTAVELKSNTTGTHTTKGPVSNPTVACAGFPDSQGSVTIKAAAGNPADSARQIEEKTKNCEDQGKSYDEKTDACIDQCESGTTNQDGTCSSESVTSCSVDGIGWIICPVMTFLAKLNDAAFNFLSGFLIVPTIDKDGGTKWLEGTKIAWDAFRNFANIAFVVAFLVIIYSQITSAGVSNYGIKRLLPRLIAAAILVNVSYYLCVIAVDVSNIIGSSLVTLFNDISTSVVDKSSDILDPDAAPGGWDSAVATLLGGGAILGILILVLLAPATLLVFGAIIFILMARQALIILLIAISPLAFVAYLLPNTEQWFKKWWNIFSNLLMVFPVIALVFGASTLASVIIGNVAADDGQMLAIMALGIQAIPLFAVPTLLKGAMSAAGTIGARLGGLQDKASGRMVRGIKEGRIGEAKNAFDRRSDLRKVNRRRGDSFLAQRAKARFGEDSLAHRATTLQSRFDRSGAGRYLGGDRGAAAAVAQYDKAFQEDVAAANILQKDLKFDDRLTIAKTGELNGKKVSEAQRVASLSHVMDNGNFLNRKEVLESVSGMQKRELQTVADGYYKAGLQGVFGAGLGDTIAQGGAVDLDNAATKVLADGKLKAETLVEDADMTAYVATIAANGKATGALGSTQIAAAKTAATIAKTNPSLESKRSRLVMDGLDRIEAL